MNSYYLKIKKVSLELRLKLILKFKFNYARIKLSLPPENKTFIFFLKDFKRNLTDYCL
jgi:hypothetical protein